MCDAGIGVSVALGALSALSSVASSMDAQSQQDAQNSYQSSVAAANAQYMRQQADVERQKGTIEERKVDDERSKLRKIYEAEAGGNRAVLAGRGVELGSGSAEDFLTGSAEGFSSDIETNRYNRAAVRWEAEEQARKAEFGASQYDSQASWLKRSTGNVGKSLLTAGLAGLGTGLSVYGSTGGFKGAPASSAGNSTAKNNFFRGLG